MSLFQCGRCGVCENSSLGATGCGFTGEVDVIQEQYLDYSGIEDRKGIPLCSECGPTKYSSGKDTDYGKWHGKFDQVFLPMNEFETCQNTGDLVHIESGIKDFRSFATTIVPYRMKGDVL